MKLEFVYLIASLILSAAYYLVARKLFCEKHIHSYVLSRAMRADVILNVFFSVLCLITLLTINGVAKSFEIKYVIDIFRFLLRTPNLMVKSMLWMNISICFLELGTMLVAFSICAKRRDHKNLKLEKVLMSDCVVCFAFTVLSTLEIVVGFLLYI